MKRILKDIKSKKDNEVYNVILTYDDSGNLLLNKSNCTCIFGSFYRFAGYWKRKEKLCRHMLQAIKEEKENGRK